VSAPTDDSRSVKHLRWLGVTALVLGLSSCGGGKPEAPVAFLHVSVSDFYFGTRNVGTTAMQTIEISNRSGDVYPIHHLTIKGPDADEFNISFGGGITLNPSQKIAVDVSFSPLTNGSKNALLDIDYEIIEQVSAADNLNEQTYYAARDLEAEQRYTESRERYEDYLDNNPATVNRKRAEMKLPVLDESERYGTDADSGLYMQAMNNREEGRTAEALANLEDLLQSAPGGYLNDDAIYLTGYIQLIDHDDPVRAAATMARLRSVYPDSTYFDTALYSEALSLEEMGDTAAARLRLEELIERHRSASWARFNLNMPRDEFVSRLWFKRASDSLARLDAA